MSQSLSKLYVHLIFHVKDKSNVILDKDSLALYAYIGSIIKDNQSIPIIINGMPDHLHILCVLSKNIAMAKLVEEIKRHSSRWIKTQDQLYRNFAWQGGYAVYSVSQSMHDKTFAYIKNQEVHHRSLTFREEYLLFLKEYQIEFDEKYLWT